MRCATYDLDHRHHVVYIRAPPVKERREETRNRRAAASEGRERDGLDRFWPRASRLLCVRVRVCVCVACTHVKRVRGPDRTRCAVI